jgi:outer membrane protein TolC
VKHLWLALGCSVVLCAQAEPTGRIDVLGVHQRALQSAPSLRAADAAQAEQQARQQGARAQLGPQLTALWQQGGGSGATGGTLSQGALQITQPLVDLPRWRQLEAEALRLRASDLLRTDAEQQLRARSAALYVQLHAARSLSRVQQALQDAFAEEAQRMQVRHREGLTAAVDWRQSESFLLLAQSQARAAVRQERTLRQSLVAHTGQAELANAPLRPLGLLALPLVPEADPAAAAPRLLALQQERSAREAETRAADAAVLPQLALQAQAQRFERGPARQGSDWQLQLRIPLWDSGSRRANEAAIRSRVQAVSAELELLQRELAREQATQLERLAAARDQHASSQQGLDGALQTVRAMRIGQEQGGRSTTDVLQAIQTQGQLQQLAVQAQLDAWLAWIDTLTAQGRFDEQALQQLNAALE